MLIENCCIRLQRIQGRRADRRRRRLRPALPRAEPRRSLLPGGAQPRLRLHANHHAGGRDFIHNTAHQNAANYNLLNVLADVPGYGHFLRNNLGLPPAPYRFQITTPQPATRANNFYDLPVSVTAEDFRSDQLADAGDRTVSPSWTTLPGAVRHSVARAVGEAAFAAIADGLASPEYEDASAANGTSYRHTVTARTDFGGGAPSTASTARSTGE